MDEKEENTRAKDSLDIPKRRGMTKAEQIIRENAESRARRKVIKELPRIVASVTPEKSVARAPKTEPKLTKGIVMENNLQVISKTIRDHGITIVDTKSPLGRKMVKQERFLHVLDMLFAKAITKADTKAAVEYLNRTAGSVAQTVDFNESKKKLIMMGTGQTQDQVQPKAREFEAITGKKVLAVQKPKKEDDE